MTAAFLTRTAKILQFPARPIATSHASQSQEAATSDLDLRPPVDIDAWYHKAAIDEEFAARTH